MIECSALCVSYGKKAVLENVSLRIEKGELVAIVGRNAAGKTTLLRALLNTALQAKGDIAVDGTPLCELSRATIARKISYLPQMLSDTPLSVNDAVLMGRLPHLTYPRIFRECDREAARDAMEKMGILQYKDTPVSQLSGGYRRRCALACALATGSDYLLLDEPTSFLDAEGAYSLLRTLRTIADSGNGVLAVLHDLPLALRFADSLLVLDAGRIVASDTPEALFESGILDRVFSVRVCRTEFSEGYAYFTVEN